MEEPAGQSQGHQRPSFCDCIAEDDDGRLLATSLEFHIDEFDPAGAIGAAVERLLWRAAEDRREELAPAQDLPPEVWNEVRTLPSGLGLLRDVKSLMLYRSALQSIPPDIGRMSKLKKFTPYTSYNLHWFPYEITRCGALRASTVSTRVLYGNFKSRLPFPQLPARLPSHLVPSSCSVCDGPFEQGYVQRWITLRVATDDLPLLVHACSESCVSRLPEPAAGYVQHPHLGGPDLEQPPGEWE